MRTILIKNASIQFDSFDNGADIHTVWDMLDAINEVLQERFPDAQPQIFSSGIDSSDVEISMPEDERGELIEKILDNCYAGDHAKYRDSNRTHLNSLSDEELQDKWDEWKNSQD